MDGSNANMLMLYFEVLLFTIIEMCSCDHINKNGTCTRTFGQGQNTVVNFCCRHFEYINGQCQACKPGFTTYGNTPCYPCETGSFGERCANTCHCKRKERCDNIEGCVVVNQIQDGLDIELSTQTVFNDNSSDTKLKKTDFNDDKTRYYVYGTVVCLLLLVFVLSVVGLVVLNVQKGVVFDRRSFMGNNLWRR